MDAESLKKQGTERQLLLNSSTSNKSNNWRVIGLAIFFICYLLLGAGVFSAIEAPIEKEEVHNLLLKKGEFLSNYGCITESALDDLIEEIVEANNRGVSIANNDSMVMSWSFGQSFFFASTVVTTIGYGHQSPLSAEGKVFCMIYALIGIPMTLLLLTAIVEKLMVPLKAVLHWMMEKIGHIYKPFTIRLLHLFGIIGILIIFFFLIPAMIFAKIESHWNLLDAIYYCFISMTTIGLGDFIPGDNPGQTLRPLYKACTTLYLLLGVTAMMVTMTVFYDIPQFDLKHFFLMKYGGGDDNIGATATTSSSNPERFRLWSSSKSSKNPKYTTQNEDEQGSRTTIVRARSRREDDSPSPVEEFGSHSKPR